MNSREFQRPIDAAMSIIDQKKHSEIQLITCIKEEIKPLNQKSIRRSKHSVSIISVNSEKGLIESNYDTFWTFGDQPSEPFEGLLMCTGYEKNKDGHYIPSKPKIKRSMISDIDIVTIK